MSVTFDNDDDDDDNDDVEPGRGLGAREDIGVDIVDCGSTMVST